MSPARPVSRAFPATKGSYKCFVELDGQLCEATWQDPLDDYPDFASVPTTVVQLSPEVQAEWSRSSFLDFGANAIFRSYDNGGQYPIKKLAHPTTEARLQIEKEWEAIQELVQAGFTGMAKIDPEPLRDDQGIFGFRMERLFDIAWNDPEAMNEEANKVVQELHMLDYSHGDLHPRNMMVNATGRLVLIDFAYTGTVGQELSSYFQYPTYENGVFDTAPDEDALSSL